MDTTEFLARHFAGLRTGEQIEIRCVRESDHNVARKLFDSPTLAASFALAHNRVGYHAYYGVNPRKAETPGGREAIARITHVWADVDDADEYDIRERIESIELLGLPQPETFVRTGGGLQVLWRLEGDDPAIGETEDANKALAHALYGDQAACDISRLLRLPDTINHKKKYPPNTRTVGWAVGGRPLSREQLAEIATRNPPKDTLVSALDRFAPSHRDTKIDANEFYEALFAIDPWSVSYDGWLRILMAVHAFDSGPEGQMMAIQWGQGQPHEVPTKWRSFRREGVNPATVFHFARQAGWRPRSRPDSTRETPWLGTPDPANTTTAEPIGTAHIPPTFAQKRPTTISLTPFASFLEEQDSGPRWVVDDLLNAGGTSLLVAKQKVGKSTFAANLAVAVASGTPFLGHRVQQGSVHVYSFEVHRAFVRQQYEKLARAHKLATPPPIWFHASTGIVVEPLAQIAEHIMREKPALVILDTLAKAVDTIRDGNNYLEVYRALQPIIALAEASGAHIVCVHHANKGLAEGTDAVMGSVGFAASVDLTMLLRRDRDSQLRTLEIEARFLPEQEPVAIDFDPETRQLVHLGARDKVLKDQARTRVLAVLATQPGLTQRELQDATGLPQELLGKTLYDLERTFRVRSNEERPRRYDAIAYTPRAAPPPPEQGAIA